MCRVGGCGARLERGSESGARRAAPPSLPLSLAPPSILTSRHVGRDQLGRLLGVGQALRMCGRGGVWNGEEQRAAAQCVGRAPPPPQNQEHAGAPRKGGGTTNGPPLVRPSRHTPGSASRDRRVSGSVRAEEGTARHAQKKGADAPSARSLARLPPSSLHSSPRPHTHRQHEAPVGDGPPEVGGARPRGRVDEGLQAGAQAAGLLGGGHGVQREGRSEVHENGEQDEDGKKNPSVFF